MFPHFKGDQEVTTSGVRLGLVSAFLLDYLPLEPGDSTGRPEVLLERPHGEDGAWAYERGVPGLPAGHELCCLLGTMEQFQPTCAEQNHLLWFLTHRIVRYNKMMLH